MSTATVEAHAGDHSRQFVWIWVVLLAITAVEVVLAYVHFLPTEGMLFLLMALSIVKAALIVAWFMHLKFEKPSFVLALVPGVLVVISLLFAFFPDSFRLFHLRVQ